MKQQPFTTVTGPAVSLMQANIDTDAIIRIERLTGLPREQLGQHALEALRYRADGSEDARCALNRPEFQHAPFILAGPNFGCGSSREHAVWALQGRGVRCVIAPQFGDIFESNCFQNGVLALRLPMAQVREIAAQCASGAPLTVSLEKQMLRRPDGSELPFHIAETRRQALLLGLDDIGLTLMVDAHIRAWQREDRSRRPWVWESAP